MILDIHSHILPGIDDGAKNINETVSLLEMMKEQGTTAVIATPHFDLSKPTKDQKREKIVSTYGEVLKAVSDKNLPEIYLGYEVVFSYGISEIPDLDKFTLAGTNKILIELPFGRMTDRIISELEEIAFTRKLVPILAHLERYTRYEGINKIYEAVWNKTASAQVTADTVCDFWSKRDISKLIRKEIFTYIGSDAHSVDTRPPYTERFVSFIKSKHKDFYNEALAASKSLLDEIRSK